MVEHRSTAGKSRGVPTIRELIQEAIDSGRSVRQLAADSGHRVKHQTFQDLSKRSPLQFPKEAKTIAGMSQALGYPESTIVLAYAKGLGINVETDSEFALRLPHGVDGLDPEMQMALVSVARAAVNQIGVTNDLTTQATLTPGTTTAEGEKNGAGDPRSKVTPLHPADPVPDLDQVAASEGDKGPYLEPDEEDYSQDPDDHPNE